MKTRSIYILILFAGLFLFTPLSSYAQNTNELMLSAQYELTMQPNVEVNVGGAIYNKTTTELRSGSQMGSVYLTKEQFAAVENAIPKYLKFEIKKYGTLSLREFTVTNILTKEQMVGLFDVNQRTFLFGNANGQSNQNCGALGLGVVSGTFNAAMDTISNGNIGFTFIVGCNPVVVAINFTFHFSAKQTTANIPGGTEVGNSWTQSNDVTRIKQMLVTNRWRVSFWAKQGNILQPQPNDFVQFYANGTMDIVLLNLHDRARWVYNPTTRALEVTFSSGGTTYFFLKETEIGTLRGASFEDEFYFKQVANPNQPVPSSVSTKTKALCMTYWQLNFIQFGLIRVTYHPTDFVRFYPNGEYEQALLGIYGKGNWTWQNNESRLVITGTNPVTWDVTTVNNTQLSIKYNFDFGELFRAQGLVANESDTVPKHTLAFAMYPNPTQEMVNLVLQNPNRNEISISVFDLLGRSVIQEKYAPSQAESRLRLNISHLSQGVYWVRIQLGDLFAHKSLVVKE